jgi:four helix bundle protein
MARIQGDLPDRTYRFGLAILNLVDEIPNVPKGWEMTRQLLRGGTSIGANVQEADVALTAREFALFCNIARREANESHYWLRMARDGGLIAAQRVNHCVDEASELASILATIVRKTQQHLKSKARSSATDS